MGYLVGKEISIVILTESSKNDFTLDLINWNDLMSEYYFNLIISNLQNRTKTPVSINENLCYSINLKYPSSTLKLDNISITINIIDLCRLKHI